MAIQFLNTVAVDTNVLYVDTSSNRVGIGTTSPATKLEVDGVIRATNGNSGDYLDIYCDGDVSGDSILENTNSSIVLISANGQTRIKGGNASLEVFSGTTAKIKLNSSGDSYFNGGDVGIGTTNPQSKLQIQDDTTNCFIRVRAGSTSIAGIEFGDSEDIDIAGIRYSNFSNNMRFNVNGSERMRIDSSGNVGIGTTTPGTFKLDVAGSARSNFFALRLNQSLPSESSAIYRPATGTFAIVTSAAERMRIDSSGYVGIGTTNPAELLTVSASDDVSIRINSTKNGTWTTDQKLGALEFFGNDSSGEGAGLKGYVNLISKNTFGAAFDMTFGTTDGTNGVSERMRIAYDGNVGINTTSPSQKLDVVGNIRSQFNSGDYSQLESNGSGGVIKAVQSGSTKVLFRSYGDSYILNDLGIGTTSPTASLHLAKALANNSERMGRFVPTLAGGSIYNAVGLRFEGLNYGYSMEFIKTGTYNGGALKFVNGTTQVGSIVVGNSGTSYNVTSDYRLKENIVNLTGGIERVKQLQPKRFNFIQDVDTTVDGFLAHETQAVIPEAVTGEKDGAYPDGDPIYQGIDQAKIVPLLTAALKEAIAKIENLETRIQTLENK